MPRNSTWERMWKQDYPISIGTDIMTIQNLSILPITKIAQVHGFCTLYKYHRCLRKRKVSIQSNSHWICLPLAQPVQCYNCCHLTLDDDNGKKGNDYSNDNKNVLTIPITKNLKTSTHYQLLQSATEENLDQHVSLIYFSIFLSTWRKSLASRTSVILNMVRER